MSKTLNMPACGAGLQNSGHKQLGASAPVEERDQGGVRALRCRLHERGSLQSRGGGGEAKRSSKPESSHRSRLVS